jgi:hypothetical protein
MVNLCASRAERARTEVGTQNSELPREVIL